MRKSLKLALSGALIAATTGTAMPTEVFAGPLSVAPPSAVGLSAPVDKVWYRRWGGYGYRRPYYGGYYGGYYRRYNPGAAIAAGVGLGLLGAGLAAANSSYYYGGYYPYYNYGYYPSYGYGYYYGNPYWGW